MSDDRTDDRSDDPRTRAVEPMDEPPTPEGLEAEETAEIELGGDTALTDPIDRSGAMQAGAGASVMRSSLLMGTGTVLSRLGGVLRGIALAAALGAGVVADAFTLGNTLPNVVYILIIGGALNAVFIPQLVRHMKDDSDGGDGYADRLITVVGVALLGLSVLAVLIAPWLVGLYATSKYTQDQFDLAVAFARFCLPQIFFYGVYTMLSQVLNSRGRFGAPMFAPLVNNAIAIATFVAFMVIAGPAAGADGILEPSQVTLLGLGTTLGVALQALVLVPVLLRSGYRYRARFDWKGVGLRTAGGLAAWTIGLVLVNQLAYAVIVRLATSVNAVSQGAGDTPAGLTAYTNAHLMFILPHSVITVSLVAALLPRMARAAADGRRSDLAGDVSSGMRSASSLIIPAAIALMVLGTQAGVLLFNYGQTSTQSAQITGTLAAVFALGLLPFTLYYVIQRALYALERTRTAFWLTVVLNGLNLAIAVPLFLTLQAQRPSPSNLGLLALGYVAAYWLTLVVAWIVLSRATGGLRTRETLTAIARMSLAGLAMLLVMGGTLVLLAGHVPGSPKIAAIVIIAVVGTVGGLVYLGAARLLRIDEVTDVLAMLRRRVPGLR